jgi:hypothetical protein
VRDLDERFSELAGSWEANYTRYADDLTFSSDSHRFSKEDVSTAAQILSDGGFSLNERKTRIIGGGHRHQVTGFSVSIRGPLAPRTRRRRWRALFHQAAQNPAEFTERTAEMTGIVGFVSLYDPPLASRYKETIAAVREASG